MSDSAYKPWGEVDVLHDGTWYQGVVLEGPDNDNHYWCAVKLHDGLTTTDYYNPSEIRPRGQRNPRRTAEWQRYFAAAFAAVAPNGQPSVKQRENVVLTAAEYADAMYTEAHKETGND